MKTLKKLAAIVSTVMGLAISTMSVLSPVAVPAISAHAEDTGFACFPDLTDDELLQIASLCQAEQGSYAGSLAEASLIANRYELHNGWSYGSLYDYVKRSGWWANASSHLSRRNAYSDIYEGVVNVLRYGYRTMPYYIDEHDCLSDIGHITAPAVKYDRNSWMKGETVVSNIYSGTYMFYSFPEWNSDPFGYLYPSLRDEDGGFYYDPWTWEKIYDWEIGGLQYAVDPIPDIPDGIYYLSVNDEPFTFGIDGDDGLWEIRYNPEMMDYEVSNEYGRLDSTSSYRIGDDIELWDPVDLCYSQGWIPEQKDGGVILKSRWNGWYIGADNKLTGYDQAAVFHGDLIEAFPATEEAPAETTTETTTTTTETTTTTTTETTTTTTTETTTTTTETTTTTTTETTTTTAKTTETTTATTTTEISETVAAETEDQKSNMSGIVAGGLFILGVIATVIKIVL